MGYRILVVDDSPVLRIMLQEMLTALGHEIVGDAETGVEALKVFREKKPELVTLDVSLPDMNGLEVLRKMKQIDASARVLMVTGNDQKSLETQAKSLRALGVLHKPFDEGELKSTIERLGPKISRG